MGDLVYPNHLKINGEPDGGGGIYDPGNTGGTPKYDSPCDAQDSSGGFQFTTGGGTLKSVSADIRVFLKDKDKITDIKAGDTGTLTRRGVEQQITVEEVILIDSSIAVNTVQ